MNGSSLPSYEDGDDYHDPQARDRSLRALEGRTSNDWQREGDADDEVIESENNTADIFMNIAREDSSSSLPRRRADGGGEDGRSSVVVSTDAFPFLNLGARIIILHRNLAKIPQFNHASFIIGGSLLRGGIRRSASSEKNGL